MKMTASIFLLAMCLPLRAGAEIFSSSSNFLQTLTVASNEAIFISSVHWSPVDSPCVARIQQSNKVHLVRLAHEGWPDESRPTIPIRALRGPLQIQFPVNNVHTEFIRVQTTNLFTVFLYSTNSYNVTVASAQTINFLSPLSWENSDPEQVAYCANLEISNSVVAVRNTFFGGECFTGPLVAKLLPGQNGVTNGYDKGIVTYYFTEEFATIPAIGGIQIPAGQSQIQVEKSVDMQSWRPILFKNVGDDTRGFYRLKATK